MADRAPVRYVPNRIKRDGYTMKNVFENVLDVVGNTPLVRLHTMTEGIQANVYAKVEFTNPGGSVKDRIAMHIIDAAERSGELKPGGTIIEATSGNTGAGLAMVAAMRGYQTIFVLPDKQSEEKRAALRAWGARVVVTPTNVEPDDPRSYYKTAARLVAETPNSFYANQYHNPANPLAHYESTGPELYEQLDGKIDVFIAGAGTGGTLSGVGQYLKEQNPNIKVVAIDPVGSLYYDYFHTGQLTQPHSYLLEGIGEDFLPSTMNFDYVDDVVRVNDAESFVATRSLVSQEGLFCGVSSGAAVAGGLKYVRRHDQEGLNVVILLPDSGSRYLSKVYNDNWMQENGFLQKPTSMGTLADLRQGRNSRELVTVSAAAKVPEVIGLLKLHGVSQLPVVDGNTLVGMISEKQLLERALQGERSNVDVGSLAQSNYCTITDDTDIAVLTDLFRRSKVAIVLENGKPADIITRIDLIDHISQLSAKRA
jgi:cystathionine beta-synthase